MYVVIWLSLGLFATAFTFAWVLGYERIYTKAGLSLASWAMLAITAGDLYALDEAGSQIPLAVPELQYFAGGFALLSFFVMLLNKFDEYPPRQEGAQ